MALFLWACASSPTSPGVIQDPSREITGLESDLAKARSQDVDTFAPLWFSEAEQAHDLAKQALARKDSLNTIGKHLDQARQSLENAWATARIAGPPMDRCKEARNKALKAGADKLGSPFESAENRHEKLNRDVQNQNIVSVRRNGPKVEKAYRDLEILSIQDTYLASARKTLADSEDFARNRVPAMYAQALAALDNVEKQIERDPYGQDAITRKTHETAFLIGRMGSVAHSAETFASMTPEESALYLEDLVSRISAALGLSDLRDKPVNAQVDQALSSAKALHKNVEALSAENNRAQLRIAHLEKRLYALTANQEEIIQKRMAARDNSRMLVKMQKVFSPDEADVFTRGPQFVIRLKDIDFSEGQATLTEKHFGVLDKVQDAIRQFDDPRITIEGYTDSNSTDEMNELISQMRASAVKAYLVGKKALPPDHILAIGYDAAVVGEEKSVKGIQVWINP